MRNDPDAIVVGASAGALEALAVLLPALPRNLRPAILIVVHVPPDKPSVLTDVLQRHCFVPLREAEDKEPIADGTVYFAPPNYHLLVEVDRHLSLSSDEAVLFSRPSIDVLFESAADAYGSSLAAIVLSGANQDGAAGLQAVAAAGGTAIVQDPLGAFASTMPEAARVMCPTAAVLSLEEIADYLRRVPCRI